MSCKLEVDDADVQINHEMVAPENREEEVNDNVENNMLVPIRNGGDIEENGNQEELGEDEDESEEESGEDEDESEESEESEEYEVSEESEESDESEDGEWARINGRNMVRRIIIGRRRLERRHSVSDGSSSDYISHADTNSDGYLTSDNEEDNLYE